MLQITRKYRANVDSVKYGHFEIPSIPEVGPQSQAEA